MKCNRYFGRFNRSRLNGASRPHDELTKFETILSTLQKSDRNRVDILASKRQSFQLMIACRTVGMDMSPLVPKVNLGSESEPGDV